MVQRPLEDFLSKDVNFRKDIIRNCYVTAQGHNVKHIPLTNYELATYHINGQTRHLEVIPNGGKPEVVLKNLGDLYGTDPIQCKNIGEGLNKLLNHDTEFSKKSF
jgi:hypothetical protein